MAATTPSSANRGTWSDGSVSMCSIRCRTVLPAGTTLARVSRTCRTAASPMAWVAVCTPAWARMRTASV